MKTPLRGVEHPPIEPQFSGEPKDVRAEAHALHRATHRDFGALSVHLVIDVKSPSTKPI